MAESMQQVKLPDLMAASSDEGVKSALSTAKGLRSFLLTIEKLEADDLTRIVDQAIAMIEGFYVHLFFKRSMHAIDPLRRLRLLRNKIPSIANEIVFHQEMCEIFTSLRDLHTNYVLPAHFSRMVAFLPFRVGAWYDSTRRAHYVVCDTVPGFTHPTFARGVELRYYNGVPIDRAIEIAGDKHAGSNPAARHARGVAGLTRRAMNIAPPPDEEWAVIGYTSLANSEEEIKLEWTISTLPTDLEHAETSDAELALAEGLDLEGDTFRRLDRMLFSQSVVKASRDLATFRQSNRRASQTQIPPIEVNQWETSKRAQQSASSYAEAAKGAVVGTDSTMPLVFDAQPVTVNGRKIAHVRIYTFMVEDDELFVNEFVRLIGLPEMPQDGLIIDVRGNGGGLIWAGERLLQLFTPRTIEPCRAQFISTPQSLLLVEQRQVLSKWAPSLRRALATGAPYSAAFPITPPAKCNDIGQRYYGPVVLVTDARSYSTTDIFAAGFRDHGIGKILGTDENMGAGGANVWNFDVLRTTPGSALLELPRGAGMRVAIRRTLRVGEEAGTEMEDLGVPPDERHFMTKEDLLGGNPDLIAFAAGMLAQMQGLTFQVTSSHDGTHVSVALSCSSVDYVETVVNGRSYGSTDVSNNSATIKVPASPGSRIELRGYRGSGEHVCSRRWTL